MKCSSTILCAMRFRRPAPLAVPDCLLFRLGGLSKSAGLPQLKLGWMTVEGPAALVDEALDRLELICDTYLSVGTPVQVATRALLETSVPVRDQIHERVRGNLGHLREAMASSGWRRHAARSGRRMVGRAARAVTRW